MRDELNDTRIHIRNGRLIDPKNGIDGMADVFIANARIAAIGQPPADFTAERTLDASGLAAPSLRALAGVVVHRDK